MVSHQDIFITFARCDIKPSILISLNFPIKSTVLRKTRLVRTEFADDENCSGSGSGSGWFFAWCSFFCVYRSPFRGCLRFMRMVGYFLFKYLVFGQIISQAKK